MSDDGPNKSDQDTAASADPASERSTLKEAFASFDRDGAKESEVRVHDVEADSDDQSAEAAAPGATSAHDQDGRIAHLESEVASLNDQMLRAVADLQNARKRAERDRRDAETYGGVKLARDVLAVYDNLDQALQHASEDLKANEPGFFNGVSLTLKELLNAFAKHKITPIQPEPGERFDPNRHQAMYEQPHAEIEPGCVVATMQVGFMISDRLLRPAMVGVAKAVDPGAEAATG
ncbi:MAG: nucleotide exchange factor GrpE [Pseudomonadota bacterium]